MMLMAGKDIRFLSFLAVVFNPLNANKEAALNESRCLHVLRHAKKWNMFFFIFFINMKEYLLSSRFCYLPSCLTFFTLRIRQIFYFFFSNYKSNWSVSRSFVRIRNCEVQFFFTQKNNVNSQKYLLFAHLIHAANGQSFDSPVEKKSFWFYMILQLSFHTNYFLISLYFSGKSIEIRTCSFFFVEVNRSQFNDDLESRTQNNYIHVLFTTRCRTKTEKFLFLCSVCSREK